MSYVTNTDLQEGRDPESIIDPQTRKEAYVTIIRDAILTDDRQIIDLYIKKLISHYTIKDIDEIIEKVTISVMDLYIHPLDYVYDLALTIGLTLVRLETAKLHNELSSIIKLSHSNYRILEAEKHIKIISEYPDNLIKIIFDFMDKTSDISIIELLNQKTNKTDLEVQVLSNDEILQLHKSQSNFYELELPKIFSFSSIFGNIKAQEPLNTPTLVITNDLENIIFNDIDASNKNPEEEYLDITTIKEDYSLYNNLPSNREIGIITTSLTIGFAMGAIATYYYQQSNTASD